MKPLVIIVASLVLFLVAPKLRGRQPRLEREARGFLHVTFGSGDNPPEVESLWAAERVRFWATTAAFAAISAVACFFFRPGSTVTAAALLSWAPSASFFVCGALSF